MSTHFQPSEPRAIAVRAYAGRTFDTGTTDTQPRTGKALSSPSEYTLVFDTETRVDLTQQLRVGGYQVYQGSTLRQAGFFVDPDSLSSEELDLINGYADRHRLDVKTRDSFVEDIFFGVGYELRARIVGFNLPFDLSRLAIRHASARGKRFRGGFSFQLSPDPKWPRVQVKHLSSRAALIQFTSPGKQREGRGMRRRKLKVPTMRGFFIDVKTIAAAMTAQSHSLESLSNLLQTAHRKQASEEHGQAMTAEYLDYAVLDVQITWECFSVLRQGFEALNLKQTPLHTIYSEAGMGKAYFKEMAIAPWTALQADFPPELIGIVLSSYFGARSEVHRRREIVRVLYCDFLSMYPTVCTLMGLWRYIIAQGVDWYDATGEIQSTLESIGLADMKQPTFWQSLTVLVQVKPDGDLFPIRSRYDETSYTIGLNHLTSHDQPLWFTLADCIASKLLTGKAPKVLKAIRFSHRDPQVGRCEAWKAKRKRAKAE